MSKVRIYGAKPYHVAVLHGGPGAPGYMAPVARELARHVGVLEPLQTKDSLQGQIEELRDQLGTNGLGPFVLIGSSWGAVLALLVAAHFPSLVKKLVLVGSAVFDAESSRRVKAIRLERTSAETLEQIKDLERQLALLKGAEKNALFARIADLEFAPDVYDPLTRDLELLDTQIDLNQKVWREFVQLRDRDGALSEVLRKVTCDTVVVHGDHDPHVIEGILPFLKSCIPQTRLEWLEKCGHYPWLERHAKDRFFELILRECL